MRTISTLVDRPLVVGVLAVRACPHRAVDAYQEIRLLA
jgi:hypothetical protein